MKIKDMPFVTVEQVLELRKVALFQEAQLEIFKDIVARYEKSIASFCTEAEKRIKQNE